MASLFVRGNYYYIRYYDRLLGYTSSFSTGEQATREGRTRANQKLKELETRLYLNRFDPLTGGFGRKRKQRAIKISEAYELFKKYRMDEGKTLSDKTLEAYKNALEKLYKAVGDTYIHLVDKDINVSLKAVFDRDNNSGNSRSIYTRALASLFNFLVRQEYLDSNPIRPLPVVKKKPKHIPLEDIRTMLAYLKEREKYYQKSLRGKSFRQAQDLIKLLAMSGLRISEADALRWEHIDLERRIMAVQNIKEGREDDYHPVPEELHNVFVHMGPRPEGKVFDRFDTKRSVRRIWRTMMEKLHMDYDIHQLRKTTTTVLIEAGVPISMVQLYDRHRSELTTRESYLESRALPIKAAIDSKVIFNL